MHKQKGNAKIGQRLGPASLWSGHGWPPRKYAPPPSVILSNLVVLGQTVRALVRRSTWKKLTLSSRLSRSLKVIGTDTDRSAAYDYLLTFHGNHGFISYRLWDKRRFQSKFAKKIPNPEYLASLWGVTLGIGYPRSGSKTRVVWLPGRERSLTISLALWIHTRTWRTDRHRMTAKTALTHSIAR